MIRILEKKDCCGCSACQQICPKTCIRMEPDEEGFLYPNVDETICIDCGLCEKVCPVINQCRKRVPSKAFAVWNCNEITRLNSSSGGVFSAIAIQILKDGGVVFGAKFNDRWEVVHDYIEKIEDLYLLQGSKYVQSVIGNTYSIAEIFLKRGRKVLFTGTSCQIAGLKRFLRTDYDNLLTIDVICHGVPSPMIWYRYLDYIISNEKLSGVSSVEDISNISFRSKLTGWKNYSFQIRGNHGELLSECFYDNLFMQGFLCNLYLRPSCHSCPAKSGKSGSDVTLGDYWGVSNHHPELDDDKGISAVLDYNDVLYRLIPLQECNHVETKYEYIVRANSNVENSSPISPFRILFWDKYQESGVRVIGYILDKIRLNPLRKVVYKLRRIFRLCE